MQSKILKREFKLKGILFRALSIYTTIFQVYKICKNPAKVLNAYFFGKSIESILLRNGYRIFLSSSKHDVATFIVIFCKKEYGNFSGKKRVIDIGANIGIFSMYAIYNGSEQVYSFEPNSESFNTLLKTITENKLQNRWKPFHVGVTAKNGDKIYILKKSSPGNISWVDVGGNQAFEEVNTISINQFLKENHLGTIDLMKVDCEGAEYEILPSISSEISATISEFKIEFHGLEEPLVNWLKMNKFKINKLQHNTYEENLGYLWASR